MSYAAARARWHGVEVRHLVAFEAIVRAGSFRAAATDLGYAQSAVSQQLSHLERLLGVRLIERAPGTAPIELTPAGEALMEHAGAVLRRLRAARSDLAGERVAALRLGALESVAARVLPRVLPGFAHADVAIEEAPTDAPLLERLGRGDLDLAVCQLPLPDGPFAYVELLRDPFVLLVASDHPLARRATAPAPAALARMPRVGFYRARADELLGSEPSVRSDRNATVQGLVAEGVGVAIVPRLCVDPHHPGTTAIDLPALPPRTLAAVWHRERRLPEPAEALVDAIRAACAC